MGFFGSQLNYFPVPITASANQGLTAMGGYNGKIAMCTFGGVVNVLTLPGGALIKSFTHPVSGRYFVSIKFFDDTHLGAFDNAGNGYVLNTGTGIVTAAGTGTFWANLLNSLTQKAQAFAVDTANTRGLGIGLPGTVTKLDSSGGHSVVTLTGATIHTQLLSIIFDGTSNYYGGGSDGNVYVFDITGAISNTSSIPGSPNFGTGPTMTANSMAIIGTNLFVASSQGVIARFDITGTPTYQDSEFSGNCGYPPPLLSNPVNGLVLLSLEGSGQFGGDVQLMDYGMSPYMQVDEIAFDTLTNLIDLYIDSASSTACIGTQDGVVVWDCNGLVTTSTPTRCQNTFDHDVAQRIIRVVNPKEYRGRVETDQNVASGFQTVTNRFQNVQYTEISSSGSGPEQLDVRRFP